MPYTINENYRLRRIAKFGAQGNTVLDIGCAEKPNIFLKNKYVVGLDLESANLPSNYSKFIQADVKELLELNLTYDVVVAGEILEHLEDPIGFLRQCKSCLTNGGKLILSTPNPHSPFESILTLFLNKRFFYTKDHVMLFPQRWLIRMLERAGFIDIKLYSGGLPIPIVGLIPCPRFFCHQTIAVARSDKQENA